MFDYKPEAIRIERLQPPRIAVVGAERSERQLSALPASDALNAALRTNVVEGLIVNFAKPWNNGGMANVPGSYALLA